MIKDIISIEKVLNSRCSSSLNTNHKKGHWGTFINRQPKKDTINQIINCCDIPRISNGKLLYYIKNGYVILGFKKSNDFFENKLLHIESGMQQQAVHLACTALGIGTCINSQGINGTEHEGKIITAKHHIMDIEDPYDSGKFTTKAPGPKKGFKPGKILTPPQRDGQIKCLPQLQYLKTSRAGARKAGKKDISQLLWAAKGRTSHLICMNKWRHIWGLTIPTWGGGQNYTDVYLLKNNHLFNYINWTKNFSWFNKKILYYTKKMRGNPTHDLQLIKKIKNELEFDNFNTSIILCQNEMTNRSLWEIGYMLENMFLQSISLDIKYKFNILKTDEISYLSDIGIKKSVAALMF